MMKILKKNTIKNNFKRVAYFHTSKINLNEGGDNKVGKVFQDVFNNEDGKKIKEKSKDKTSSKDKKSKKLKSKKLKKEREEAQQGEGEEFDGQFYEGYDEFDSTSRRRAKGIERVEKTAEGEKKQIEAEKKPQQQQPEDDFDPEEIEIPDSIKPYSKYLPFSQDGEKRFTNSEDNAYYEEIRRKGETSSEDEIEIRRDLMEEIDGELVKKKIDPSMLKFADKFQRTIKKKKPEEIVVAQYGETKLVKKPHPFKQIEDLVPEDFTPSDKEVRTDSDDTLHNIKSDGSETEIAPHLNDRMRREAFERLQYGDYELREEIYKDAPFYEKPISIQHSTISKEAQRLLPVREQTFNNYYDAEKKSSTLNIEDVMGNLFGETLYPEKLESFINSERDHLKSVSLQNPSNQDSQYLDEDGVPYYSKEAQSEFDVQLDSLFFEYTQNAINYQINQLEGFTGRKVTNEEHKQFFRRTLEIGEDFTFRIPRKLDIRSHPQALKDQFQHALDLALEKVKEYNPTLVKEELDDSNYTPQFDKEAVVNEAYQNVEEIEFDKQWEVVQNLRKGKVPHYLNFYLSLYDLRFRKFYPKRAKQWVEYAKTPRGYFGRDAQWHIMTKKEMKLLAVSPKHLPTQHTELFQPYTPVLDPDLQQGYRFGFLKSEIDNIHNLSPKLKDLLSFHYAYPAEVKKFRIFNELNLWKRHPLDTGSPEIQVAVFSVRLDNMKKHISRHKKDFKTKIALQVLSNRRKVMMGYLKKKNVRKYFEVLYHLKIPDLGSNGWNTSWPC